jgi:hypothetical protein
LLPFSADKLVKCFVCKTLVKNCLKVLPGISVIKLFSLSLMLQQEEQEFAPANFFRLVQVLSSRLLWRSTSKVSF